MIFKFECPYCGQRIAVDTATAEAIGVCPACGRDVEVPDPNRSRAAAAFAEYEASLPKPKGALLPALVALLFCLLPAAVVIFPRALGLSASGIFKMAVGAASLVGITGIVIAHRTWRRSAGQFLARLTLVLSLISGYLLTLATVLLLASVELVKPVNSKEIPDFVATPAKVSPAVKASPVEKASPPPAPASQP